MFTLAITRQETQQREGLGRTPTLEQGLQDGHVDVLVLLGANVKHRDLF